MTITSILFIPAAQPGPTPNFFFARGSGRQASHRVACLLAATLVGAPLVAGLLAGGTSPKAHATPTARPRPVLTDSPRPAYVQRLERDPFR